jgi:hypothetical protein
MYFTPAYFPNVSSSKFVSSASSCFNIVLFLNLHGGICRQEFKNAKMGLPPVVYCTYEFHKNL